MLFRERDCTCRKKESAVTFSIPSNVFVSEILANTCGKGNVTSSLSFSTMFIFKMDAGLKDEDFHLLRSFDEENFDV
jgi:hypothetical protein